MSQQPFPPSDMTAKIMQLDQESDVTRMGATLLLNAVHRIFPLEEAGMGPDFRGSHSIVLVDDTLQINVCWKGRIWSVSLS